MDGKCANHEYLLAFEFDRKLKPSHAVGVPQVQGFCDGGEKAYGAVIFLRWELKNGSYKCVPVLIKSFVAPLKKKTIPRLELMGCLTLARMYDTCRTSLQFANIQDCKRIFWVDSSTVLSWIRTPPRNKWFRTRENVHVDDLVLELDQTHKRSQWKLACIIVTYPGKDGLVRKARIKTQDGEYDRPIHKLCLLATKEELNAEFS